MICDIDGESAAEHNGSWDGTSTQLRFYLEQDRAVVVLCNDGACDVAELLNQVDCAVEDGLEEDGCDDDDGDDDEEDDDEQEEEEEEEAGDDDEEEEEEEEEAEEEEEEEEEGVCSGTVVHLTNKTFHPTISAAPLALVDFFATWCHTIARKSPCSLLVLTPAPLSSLPPARSLPHRHGQVWALQAACSEAASSCPATQRRARHHRQSRRRTVGEDRHQI